MLVSYFKKQQPATILALVIFFLLLKLPFLIKGSFFPVQAVFNLWGNVGIILGGSFYLNFFIAQLFLVVQIVIFNLLFRAAGYHESTGVLPSVYYMLLSSLHPAFNQFTIYTVTVSVLLWMFYVLLQITVKESARIECFNLGFIGGILVSIDTHTIVMLPFLFLMLYALKPFRLEEYLLLFFGILCPFYLVLSIGYIVGWKASPISLEVFQWFRFDNDSYNKILFAGVGVYLFFSILAMQGINFSAGFKRRKNVNMLAFFFLGITIVVALSGAYGEPALSLLFIPVSIFLTLLMLRIRKIRLAEFLNLIFVIAIFTINILRVIK